MFFLSMRKFQKLAVFREKFEKLPIICLTASATRYVQTDILQNLKIKRALVLRSTYNRPNLS
jgi:superfamily II DNA helicase RecQ